MHVMTSEQTPSADEDHAMQSKASGRLELGVRLFLYQNDL